MDNIELNAAAKSYKVAIIGSGPAGLSAATHAAELNIPHVLLESTPNFANTIFRYQKGKHVMSEPGVLPLRSPLEFEAGTREAVLKSWQEEVQAKGTNILFNAEVKELAGGKGDFHIVTADGQTIVAENIVMAIGVQGNLRKLGVAGENLPQVQYQLDDPDEYEDETIVVVGAGDAAIENALALAENNTVIIVNRRDEFNRAKDGNLDLITRAIKEEKLECMYKTTANRVEPNDPENGSSKPCVFVLDTSDGEATVPCDRIIARLGGVPSRNFLESCGIIFPNDEPAAVPAVSEQYESNVPGLYIIGVLAGFPLIKECLNQGHDVIEYIEGNDIEPVDESLLWEKMKGISGVKNVNEGLQKIISTVPLLSGLTTLQLREFMLDSKIITPEPGTPIFKYNDYTNSIYSILKGSVGILINLEDPIDYKNLSDIPENYFNEVLTIKKGEFFGEMSLISGRRRSATVIAGKGCELVETPRRSMSKLINSVESVQRIINETFMSRSIQTHLVPTASVDDLKKLVSTAKLEHYKPNDVILKQGDQGDDLYLIRAGSVTISRAVGDHEIVLAYLPAGNYFGEIAVLIEGILRTATVTAATATDTIRLEGKPFRALLDRNPILRKQFKDRCTERVTENVERSKEPESGDIISFLMEQGLGEASDVLLIDESICVGCDICEKACAETHDGASRLNRHAGPRFASLHVPTSCRHCEHPHCMKDCPPDAIHRSPNGEVFIDDSCIGCGNCEKNCPYDVIQMTEIIETYKSNLWSWLLFDKGIEPGKELEKTKDKNVVKKAIKCDMCKDMEGGPACVRSCPTGAAIRVSPEEFMKVSHT
ncbi:MAG: NAD(P)-binding domain-containing protein [Proteobacteria bacterium]|nr:NAD(P)-binding domain-containing protein [Pseudomonadota bacterium]